MLGSVVRVEDCGRIVSCNNVLNSLIVFMALSDRTTYGHRLFAGTNEEVSIHRLPGLKKASAIRGTRFVLNH